MAARRNSVSIRIGTDGKATVIRDFDEIAAGGGVAAERLRAKWDREVSAIEVAAQRASRTAQRLQAVSTNPVQARIETATGVGAGRSGAAEASARALAQGLDQAEAEARQLLAAIDPLFAAQQRYGTSVAQLNQLRAVGALEEQRYIQLLQAESNALDEAVAKQSRLATARQQQAQAGFNSALGVGDGSAARSAAESAAVFTDELERQEAQARQLIAAIDPLYAAQQRYGVNVALINELKGAGAITEQRYLQLLQAEDDALDQATIAAQRHGVATGAAGARSVQASQQFQDFFIQVQGGQSVIVAFSQQLSQLAFVLQGSQGAAGKFASFMSGGYGTAILLATMLLGPFIARLFDTRTELQKASDELAENARKTDLTRQAQERYSATLPGLIDRIREQTAALQAQNQTMERTLLLQAGTALGEERSLTTQLDAKREELRLARVELDRRSRNTGAEGEGAEYAAQQERVVRRLEGEVRDAEASARVARTNSRNARATYFNSLADADATGVGRATRGRDQRYQSLTDEWLAPGSTMTDAEYYRRRRQITTEGGAAIEAARDAERPHRGGSGRTRAETLADNAEAMEVNAAAAMDLARAYLVSGDAALRAESSRKALTDATRRGIDTEAQVRRQLAIDIAEVAVRGAQEVRQIEDETEARAGLNDRMLAGRMTAREMQQALQEELTLRPLLTARAQAQGEQYEELTRIIERLRASIRASNQEAARSDALQQIVGMARDEGDLVARARLIGANPLDRAVGDARIRATREADERGYQGDERNGFIRWREQGARNEWDFGALEDINRQNQALDDRVTLLQFELRLGAMGGDQRARALRLEQMRLELQRQFGPEHQAEIALILQKAAAEEELRRQIDQVHAAQQELEQTGGQIIDEVFNIQNWDDWGEAGKRVIQMLLQELITLAAVNPLKNLLFGQNNPTLGGVLGTLLGVAGAAFGGGGSTAGALNGFMGGGSSAAAGALNGFMGGVGGHAMGTENFSGGMTWIAENGPELVNLPRGSKITPAAKTRQLLGQNDNSPMVFAPVFDLRNAVMTEDLLRQMQAMADKAARDGARGGAQAILRGNRDSHGRLLRAG